MRLLLREAVRGTAHLPYNRRIGLRYWLDQLPTKVPKGRIFDLVATRKDSYLYGVPPYAYLT